MSRKIFAAILGLGLICNLGCGSKPQPQSEQPNAVLTPEPKVELPPPVVKVNHEMDPAKHVIPHGPVTGRVGNVNVSVAEVKVEGRNLVLQKPSGAPGDNWRVTVELPSEPGREGSPSKMVGVPSDNIPGTAWTVELVFPKPVSLAKSDAAGAKTYEVLNRPLRWQGACAITVEFGKRENGKLPGKVYLSAPNIPDAHPDTPTETVLAGTFVAESARQLTDPPGAEDVPYIDGSVSLASPSEKGMLRVGYVGLLSDEGIHFGEGTVELDGGQSVRIDFKPSVTTVVAGDGKAKPSHYEHSKLTPGRYLVYANLPGGPIASKWVDVKAGGKVTVDLTVDPKFGGVEVAVPLEALGKVSLSPADEASRPALSEVLFQGVALQLGLEADIVARKAKFNQLAPGRYEVRAAKQTRTIEIVAGKTVELDFDKK